KVATAKIFPHGKSKVENQDEVFIAKEGDAVILFPEGSKFNILFDSLEKFSDDFMSQREQPE
ncbi:MAG: hypothetical protein Q7S59_11580, partial [Sulfurimonas sp.]|nr:hypothetical protein [Sulfurimonas sp.]